MNEVWVEASPALPGAYSVFSPASLVFSTTHSGHKNCALQPWVPLAPGAIPAFLELFPDVFHPNFLLFIVFFVVLGLH